MPKNGPKVNVGPINSSCKLNFTIDLVSYHFCVNRKRIRTNISLRKRNFHNYIRNVLTAGRSNGKLRPPHGVCTRHIITKIWR